MNILGILLRNDTQVACYHPTSLTFAQYTARPDPVNTRGAVVLDASSTHITVPVTTLVALAGTMTGVVTWATLVGQVADAALLAANEDWLIPDLIQVGAQLEPFNRLTRKSKAPVIHSIEHRPYYTVGFGTADDSLVPNQGVFSRVSPDLFIVKASAYGLTLTDTLIVAVGGRVFPTLLDGTTLWVLGACTWFRQLPQGARSIQLIDLSPLGTVTRVPLTNTTITGDTIQLPEGALTGQYPIVVLDGVMFWKHEFHVINSRTLRFKAHPETRYPYMLDTVVMHQAHVNTGVFQSEWWPQSILPARAASSKENAVYLINNSNIMVNTTVPDLQVTSQCHRFPVNYGGLLVNQTTRYLVDYTRIPYSDGTLFTIAPPVQVELVTTGGMDGSPTSIGLHRNRGSSCRGQRTDSSGYVLVDIMAPLEG